MSFYCTLQNTAVSDFTVILPETIELYGQWECALTELLFPRSFVTLRDASVEITTPDYVVVHGTPPQLEKTHEARLEMGEYTIYKTAEATHVIKMPNKHYNSVKEIIYTFETSYRKIWTSKLIELMAEFPIWQRRRVPILKAAIKHWQKMKRDFNILYDVNTNKVTLFHRVEGMTVRLTDQLRYTLGFPRNVYECGVHLATYPADVTSGLLTIYVYCSVIEPQIVGDVRARLLRVLPLRGKSGEMVLNSFTHPVYVNVIVQTISSMEISIKDASGNDISFPRGGITAVLHFRQKKL